MFRLAMPEPENPTAPATAKSPKYYKKRKRKSEKDVPDAGGKEKKCKVNKEQRESSRRPRSPSPVEERYHKRTCLGSEWIIHSTRGAGGTCIIGASATLLRRGRTRRTTFGAQGIVRRGRHILPPSKPLPLGSGRFYVAVASIASAA